MNRADVVTVTGTEGPAGDSVQQRAGTLLAVCCLAQLLVVLDSSIMNVALPVVQRSLGFDQTSLQWILNAFMIPAAGFLLLAGRMCDLFGQRRLLLSGIVVFTVASLVGGVASSAGMLVAARAGQGLGAAIMAPAALAVLSSTFVTPVERAKAFGLWGAAAGSGGALGVLGGGVIVEWLSWRWVLLVNVPIGVLLLVMAFRSVVETTRRRRAQRLDIAGAVAITVGVAALVYGIASAGHDGWGSPTALSCLALAAVLLAFFLVDQARLAKEPLVPLGIFRSRQVSSSNAVMLTSGAALAGTFYFLTLFFQQVLGFSPLRTGLSYLPLSLATFVGAALGSILVTRIRARLILLGGLSAAAVALVWLSGADESSGFVTGLLGPSVLFGLGLGLVITTAAAVATGVLPEDQQGLGSGLVNTSQSLGAAAGLAVLVAVSNARTSSLAATPGVSPVHAAAGGYSAAFLVAAGLMVVSIAVALTVPSSVKGSAPLE